MKVSLFICTLALCAAVAQGAVVGIDFGGYWTKSAVVRPGKEPLQIVLNEQSKRKTMGGVYFPAVGERGFSEAAVNAMTRYPERTAKHVRQLLGKPFGSVDLSNFDSSFFPFELRNDTSKGTYRLKLGDEEFSVEEITAMILRHLQHLSEEYAEMQLKDCVITTPPFFAQKERNALLEAARIAGFNVLSLLNENTAVAFKYGIDRPLDEKTEGEKGRTVAFVDMGSSSLTVSIYKYTLVEDKTAKSKNANKFLPSLNVLGVAWDDTLGGYSLDRVVVKRLAEVFEEQHGSHPEYKPVLSVPRSLARLYKDAEKARLVLSANQEALVIIEGLVGDLDLKYKMTRSEFESLAESVLAKVKPVAERALQEANITKDDIDAVEIVGGATRTPRVKEDMKVIFEKELSTSLNADEACALGAALHATSLSGAFKLRKFQVNDGLPYSFEVVRSDDEDVKPVAIFKPYNKMPSRKGYTINDTDSDLTFTLRHGRMDIVPRSEDQVLQTFSISGVKETVEKFKNVTSSSVKVYFDYGRNGIVGVDRAEAVLEQVLTVKEEVAKNKTDTKSSAKKEKKADEDKSASDDEKKEEDKQEASETATDDESSNKADKEYIETEKKYTRRENLKLEITYQSAEAWTNKERFDAEKILRDLDKRDSDKKKADEVRNSIETYIYDTKDKLSEYHDDYSLIEKVTTEEQREEVIAALNAADDWLFEVESNAEGLPLFRAKLDELHKLGDPIFLRKAELLARPEAVAAARKELATFEAAMRKWNSTKPQITEEEKEDLSDLIESVLGFIENKTKEQEEKSLSEDPVFSASDVESRVERVRKLFDRLSRKPKPKAPKKKKPAKEDKKDKAEADKEEKADAERAEKAEAEKKEKVEENIEVEKEEENVENVEKEKTETEPQV